MNLLLKIVPIASVLLVFALRMIEVGTRRDTIAGPVRENLTFRLFLFIGVFMLIGSIAEFLLLHRTNFSWALFAAGWICALASFWIRRSAIAALGKFWSLHVEIRENHEFVRTGPFRWMRHPTYFSMILELLAVGLTLNAFFMLLIIPLVFFPALLLRLKIEEAALVEKFGEAYRQYQQKTPALFPTRWHPAD
jgi:protein-S-isoprenylcysteine O-methyltransferase Ste14